MFITVDHSWPPRHFSLSQLFWFEKFQAAAVPEPPPEQELLLRRHFGGWVQGYQCGIGVFQNEITVGATKISWVSYLLYNWQHIIEGFWKVLYSHSDTLWLACQFWVVLLQLEGWKNNPREDSHERRRILRGWFQHDGQLCYESEWFIEPFVLLCSV